MTKINDNYVLDYVSLCLRVSHSNVALSEHLNHLADILIEVHYKKKGLPQPQLLSQLLKSLISERSEIWFNQTENLFFYIFVVIRLSWTCTSFSYINVAFAEAKTESDQSLFEQKYWLDLSCDSLGLCRKWRKSSTLSRTQHEKRENTFELPFLNLSSVQIQKISTNLIVLAWT